MNQKNFMKWHFDNTYGRLPENLFSRVNPVAVSKPEIVIFNQALAENLGLDFSELSDKDRTEIFAGNVLMGGSEPIAQAYAGHQYGHFTMLGDGRAILLGEHITPDNRRVDIQLKGSGRTPYSRQGDGRAALGPMLREYIISEAMYALGIPTTRSLAVVTTGENVQRERVLPGAILTRVADSHIRVGTFEYVAAQNDLNTLKILVNYTIQRHYPHLKNAENPALSLFNAVMERQITLMIHWMRVGFVHGVMNTDNMAISGETIDYGPCAFMDAYHPNTVFSSIDSHGRYALGNQPKIAQWNLTRFAETLLPLLHDTPEKAIQIAIDALNRFDILYQEAFLDMMRKKLGLVNIQNTDENLINDLLLWMQENKADYTNTFLALMTKEFPKDNLFQDETFKAWYQRWEKVCLINDNFHGRPHDHELSFDLMQKNNPAVIPRNHKVEECIKAAQMDGDFSLLNQLLDVLLKPYENQTPELCDYQSAAALDKACSYRTFCGT